MVVNGLQVRGKTKVSNETKIQNIPFAHESISLSSREPEKGVGVGENLIF